MLSLGPLPDGEMENVLFPSFLCLRKFSLFFLLFAYTTKKHIYLGKVGEILGVTSHGNTILLLPLLCFSLLLDIINAQQNAQILII